MVDLPKQARSVHLEKPSTDTKTSPTWYDVSIRDGPLQISYSPSKTGGGGNQDRKDEEILTVRIKSFAFNHRDVWIRKGLYRNIQFGSTLGSDGMGTVIHPTDHELFGKDVLIYPAVNWIDDPRGPDVPGKGFGILGGTQETDGIGTFTEYFQVPASHCAQSPDHLNDFDASAVPLAGLTAFRAVFNKGQVKRSSNVLITGIGGGVAIWALQFCVTIGANVWVTSSSEEKIQRARQLGAKGGVNYKQEDWPKSLASLLPAEGPALDVVIDSGGGDIAQKSNKLLRPGGIIVNFGCTSGQPLTFTMVEVIRNLEIRGSTMGSLKEFKEMVEFVEKHKIKPVVHKALNGFDQVEQGFEIMRAGQQFGKIVVVIKSEANQKL